jgi:acetate kinase
MEANDCIIVINAGSSSIKLAPGVPLVGCFDTAFHTGQPAVAQALFHFDR